MSSAEFAEWMAYERVTGPLGAERDDAYVALLLAMTHNVAVKKSHRKKPDTFLPEWDRRPQTSEQMLSVVKALNKQYGGSEEA